MCRRLSLLLLAGLLVAPAQQRPQLPAPDHADVRYGPHERNVVDVWLAKSPKPTPLAIYYHGGGFRGGDKRTLNPELLDKLRANGISVAAANYRLSNVALYPAQMHDSPRAAIPSPPRWPLQSRSDPGWRLRRLGGCGYFTVARLPRRPRRSGELRSRPPPGPRASPRSHHLPPSRPTTRASSRSS